MKKIVVILSVVVIVITAISCSVSSEKKQTKRISGVVKAFSQEAQMFCYTAIGGTTVDLPRIDFSDGRYIYLQDIPDAQITIGDSIAVYYSGKDNGVLTVDSIVTL